MCTRNILLQVLVQGSIVTSRQLFREQLYKKGLEGFTLIRQSHFDTQISNRMVKEC
jgi:hypothetical protein